MGEIQRSNLAPRLQLQRSGNCFFSQFKLQARHWPRAVGSFFWVYYFIGGCRGDASQAQSVAMSASPSLRIRNRSVAELKPRTQQPRIHSRTQIRQIAESIKTFGFNNPILIDSDGTVIAGHGRVAAAKLLGMRQVPTVRLDHMTEAQVRAYALADNRLAERAKWDPDLLAIELQYLTELDLDFELNITGFENAEIDLLIQNAARQTNDADADAIPAIDPAKSPISRPGDLWILGRHRLLCGDAQNRLAYRQLLGSQRAQVVFTDPPYNVPIEGHVSGLGKARHSEFAMATGEMTESEFSDFLHGVFHNLTEHSINGSIHFIFMDWRHLYEVLVAGRQVYSELKNLCVWNKSNAGMGSLYRSKHELIFVFKNGTRPHINNIELGRHGRYRTNVWDYAGANSFGAGRDMALAMHPTVKPVALAADTLLDCSRRGAIVLDPFVGSGTTILAAEQTGRRAYAMEIDPVYVDSAIRRYEAYSGDAAVHVKSGATFREVTEQRMMAKDLAAVKFVTTPDSRSVKSPRTALTRNLGAAVVEITPLNADGPQSADSTRSSTKPTSRHDRKPAASRPRR